VFLKASRDLDAYEEVFVSYGGQQKHQQANALCSSPSLQPWTRCSYSKPTAVYVNTQFVRILTHCATATADGIAVAKVEQSVLHVADCIAAT
jgi:hypothetical protein